MFKLMGSAYFFSNYPDFKGKDTDWWEISSEGSWQYVNVINSLSLPRHEYFSFKRHKTVDKYIEEVLKTKLPMAVGAYLIPEFCQEIGFTIEHLPRLQILVDRLDPLHKYEKVIYDAYLKNGDFYLTQRQRDAAYREYKKARNQL